MKGTIWFDMDGTIADLYGVDNWLAMLRAYDATPYIQAKPMLNMSKLARLLHKAQAEGWRIGIVSWLSKEPQASYDQEVTQAKASWLKKHLCFDRFMSYRCRKKRLERKAQLTNS